MLGDQITDLKEKIIGQRVLRRGSSISSKWRANGIQI